MQPCICPFLHVYRFIKYGLLQIGNDFFCICAHRVEVLFGGHKANPQAIANKLEFEVFHAGLDHRNRFAAPAIGTKCADGLLFGIDGVHRGQNLSLIHI